MLSKERGGGLSAAVAVLIVLGIIIAAALSFNLGQNAIRLVTVTESTTNVFTVTTTQISTSTVTVTTTPPDYFQVNSLVLHSGTASSRTGQGTASIEFTVTGPLLTTSSASSVIISIVLSNATMSSSPSVFQCPLTTSCNLLSAALVKEYGVTSFTSQTTGFFIGTVIDKGQTYDYDIIFSNGNSAAGSLVAS